MKSSSLGVDLVLDSNTQTWEHSAEFGVHDIEIRLLNKELNDTVLDDQGNIVSDLYVTIESVKVNDWDFRNQIDQIVEYKDNDGNPVDTFGFIGFTTPYKMLLQTPGYILKRNMNVLHDRDVFQYLTKIYNR